MKTLKAFSVTLLLILCVLISNAKPIDNGYIDHIMNDYLAVKNALIAGKGAVVQQKAKALFADFSSLPDGKSVAPDKQGIVNKYNTKLAFDSRHMSETTDIDHQREHFASLSNNLYEFLKAMKMNTTTVYEDYCPMKKAYWLSESKEIKNPYFGDKMLTCGKVSETITPAK